MPDDALSREDQPESAMDQSPAASSSLEDSESGTQAHGRHPIMPMVGIGGSAGSIQPLLSFFQAMPPDSGMAFVVILHLSPEHDSTLPELIQRVTPMPTVQVRDTLSVEPNSIYVIPPGKALASTNGQLRVTDLQPERGTRVAVDLFFRTLADTHGPQSAAIVLSGADADGALGIKRIKERGGLTIAQEPDEAEHNVMPRAAIQTGMVDWVLPVAQMPARLLEYHQIGRRLKLPPEDGPLPEQPILPTPEEGEAALREVLSFLRTRTGHDFSYYKRGTILRRISRRMQVNGIDEMPGYLDFLRTHPGEAEALLQDLLISVTNFFRDREAFDALAQYIPELFRNKTSNDCVRAWVPGCASGEEAYSIAILLAEHARTLEAPPAIQVFATDLDEEAISAGRAGSYPFTIAADVNDERLRRFFTTDRCGYRVRQELRETLLFACHDLLRDPPFSRMDLISCRNLLIYLNRDAQTRTFNTFAFALWPEGRLFLGSSESIDDGSPHFTALDKKHRIYVHRASTRPVLTIPSGPGTLARSIQSQDQPSSRPTPGGISAFDKLAALVAPQQGEENGDRFSSSELHFKLIERFALPSLVVDKNYDIVHLLESAGRYLQFTAGELKRNLLDLVNPMLRAELRAALFHAAQTSQPVDVPGVPVEMEGERQAVNIRVRPAADFAPDFLLVIFEPGAQAEQIAEVPLVVRPDAESVARHLEREIGAMKNQLRETVEQYETSTEELKASNEELQAMNEELRSATEELETSREELQSINEELSTVNQELKLKVDELSHANSDLRNLMVSTAIPTIFLDRELRIMRYTPSAVEIFNLIPTDIGRPLTDLKHRLHYPALEEDARNVLAHLSPIEREAADVGDEHCFLARLLPYRTTEDQVGGVVLTLVDITESKRSAAALKLSETELAAELRAMENLHAFTKQLLQTPDLPGALKELLRSAVDLHHTRLGAIHLYDAQRDALELAVCQGLGADFEQECRIVTRDSGTAFSAILASRRREIVEDCRTDSTYSRAADTAERHGYRAIQTTPLLTLDGRLLGILSTMWPEPHRPSERDLRIMDLYARQAADLIASKQAAEALVKSESGFRELVAQAKAGIIETDLARHFTYVNDRFCEITGRAREELMGKAVQDIIHPEDLEREQPLFEKLIATGEPFEIEDRLIRQDGPLVWILKNVAPIFDDAQRITGITTVVTDIDSRKMAEFERKRAIEELERNRAVLWEALTENERIRTELEAAGKAKDHFLAVLSHELRTPLTPVLMAVRILSRRSDLPPDLRESLEMIRRNVRIEAQFIDDLLDVTRIARGKLEIVKEPVNLHDVIQQSIAVAEGEMQDKGQKLIVELRAAKCDVTGDATRLQQVMWNLLKNGSKFSPKKGKIRVTTWNEGRRVLTAISDNGIGIETTALHLIFDPFRQENRDVTRQFGGLGLGLAIAKATVDAHGGKLRAESPGRDAGATFIVELPLRGATK